VLSSARISAGGVPARPIARIGYSSRDITAAA
jgi:hypothetical protein